MPSTFRTFLQTQRTQTDQLTATAEPEQKFDERDESYFAAALLMARLGFHGTIGYAAFDAVATQAEDKDKDDPLASIARGPETTQALIFVSTFMCFFKVKPRSFMQAVGQFKQHFIPGFADDSSKRIQLFELVNPAFSDARLEPEKWTSLETFFRPREKEKPEVVTA